MLSRLCIPGKVFSCDVDIAKCEQKVFSCSYGTFVPYVPACAEITPVNKRGLGT